MDVSRTALQSILENIVNSLGYKTTVGPTDKGKVTKAVSGLPASRPSARLAQAAYDIARILHPLTPTPPPPPPEPTFKRVAPITVRAQGGSDQRVCLWTGAMGGSALVPGVTKIRDGVHAGKYTDESGAIYAADGDGLEDSSIRTKVDDPRLVGAREMDNRNACQCPPVGDPQKNTGSWTV